MKTLNYFATAVLVIGLAGIPALAQSQQDPPQSAQSQPGQADTQPAQQVQSFTGKIMKTSDGFVLQDDASKASYKLDDEKQAKKFSGKNVKVTGTLDTTTNTIHISNIEMASSTSY